MGSEARTTLTLGRQQLAGTALLEPGDAGLSSINVVRFPEVDTAEGLVISRALR